jgi:cytochrome P450
MPSRITKVKANLHVADEGMSVFGSLLRSDLPGGEKSVQRLTDEATAMFVAGTETISWTLTVITYHLLLNPDILDKLTNEVGYLNQKSGQLPSWVALEKLSYLSAVISEGLRLSYGVASRTSRIARKEDLKYHVTWTTRGADKPVTIDYVIPREYAIGTSSVITHHDESIFPDSYKFIPERWLDENNKQRRNSDVVCSLFRKEVELVLV